MEHYLDSVIKSVLNVKNYKSVLITLAQRWLEDFFTNCFSTSKGLL